jgi:acyl carrier protein
MGSDAHPDLSDGARTRLTAALVAVFRKAPARLTPGMRLGDIGGWDSMNAVTFSFELETAFDVSLGETTFNGQQTLADVLDVLREHGATAI